MVRCTTGGAYVLAELDGAESKTRYAAFRVIPYYAQDGDAQVTRDDNTIDIEGGNEEGGDVEDIGDGNIGEEETSTDNDDDLLL